MVSWDVSDLKEIPVMKPLYGLGSLPVPSARLKKPELWSLCPLMNTRTAMREENKE
jgi:hypothetical protein